MEAVTNKESHKDRIRCCEWDEGGISTKERNRSRGNAYE